MSFQLLIYALGKVKSTREDIERGPSLTENILNHALLLYHQIQEIKNRIGEEEYNRRQGIAIEMLQNLENQGSSKRMEEDRNSFILALGQGYKESRRQKEHGVTRTPFMLGNVPLGKIKKDQNFDSLVSSDF